MSTLELMRIRFLLNRRGVYLHKKSLCESLTIGRGTRIWAFAHILPGATIGEDCNICDNVFIENLVNIGKNVTIKSGVQLWDGVNLEDNVFIGPNVTFTNDKFPRSRIWQSEVLKTLIKTGASIGANATILPGVIIGEHAMIGAGSVVTRHIPDREVWAGNPARFHYSISHDEGLSSIEKSADE